MAEWQTVRLGEIVKTNQSTYSPKENWQFVNYLDTGNITMNKIDEIQYINTAKDKLPSRARRKVKTNSIIYSTVRPNQLHYGVIKEQPDNFLVSTGFTVIDVNYDKAVPDFIYYALTKQEVTEQLQAIAEQSVSAYPSLKPSDIENLEFMLPDKKTQERIVAILRSIDEKIKENNAINNNLLQQLDTLYDEFSHRKNWSTVIINDIAEKVAMGPFGSNIKVSTFVSEGVPIISGNHLRGYFLEEPSFNYITEEHAQRLKNSLVYPKDIVFTHAGNIGQVAMIPDDCRYPMYVLSQRQFYLRCDTEKAIPEYVVLFFHSKQGQHELLSYANQTGVPSIAQPATNLKKIPLKLPPIDEQRQWLQVVSPIIKLYQSNVYENEHLSSMRDSLLPKLMSGELDVSDINL
ncbi:restriction endonuclease subunit S [Dorea formicigenerans]|uniref:restriction endonuclease subunit S n=1 Tax=Dorea formicigenerans TaxID=39486 RepID=UPI00191D48FA|nr:restriction endonuclease subunit S [Dorea formicigenerans]